MGGLHYQERGAGPVVVLLHGLFGSGKNLNNLASALQADYRVVSFDLPGHGNSSASEGLSLQAMTATLWRAIDSLGIERVQLVGHSLGGKVAMMMALHQPQRVNALVVADIAPVAYPRAHDDVIEALQAVARAQPASRREAREMLLARLSSRGVVEFLLQSLAKTEAGYEWRMDVDGIAEHYDELRAGITLQTNMRNDSADIIVPGCFDGPVTFIGGSASGYITPDYEAQTRMLFPNMRYREIAGAGHWLHAEKPALFARLVRGALV